MKRFIEYICEDRESKNMHKARRWIEENHPEVIGQKLDNGTVITPQKLIEEIRNAIPSSRLSDCKFLVGVTRLYFENQRDPDVQRMFGKLNKILKILATAHADEYDGNLNGLSFEQLDQKFSGAVQKELSADREDIDKLALIKQSDYEIVPIDSFQEAEKYGKYTSWCVTHYENMYNSYTNGGLGRFYFCLRPGYEKVKAIKGDGCPMDEYGKSMIAISVNDDGSLNTCTCRWNHDNGGNDNMMGTKEISEFFGVNFYKTFVPYPPEKILEKYSKYRIADDEISKALHAMKIKLEDPKPYYIRISQKGNSIEKFFSISEDIISSGCQFYQVQNGQLKSGAPQKVYGYFNCAHTEITSLKGAPQEVGGDFSCSDTRITSLQGAPQKVGGGFYCSYTEITSLQGAPQEVGGGFYCSYTEITSLQGAPSKVGGNFYCLDTEITSLQGAPSEVGGNFYCSHTEITSLEGAPSKVGGDFSCSDTNVPKEKKDKYIEFLRHPTPEHIDDTGHYTEKPVVRESLYVQKWADMYRKLFRD